MTSSTTISNSEFLRIFPPASRRELSVVPVASTDLVSRTVSNAVAAQPALVARRTSEWAEILERSAARIDNEAANWSRLLAVLLGGRQTSAALCADPRLACGGVVVNGTRNYRPPFVPFGGVKQSGLGSEGLGYTLAEMSQPRYTVLRRIRNSGAAGNS